MYQYQYWSFVWRLQKEVQKLQLNRDMLETSRLCRDTTMIHTNSSIRRSASLHVTSLSEVTCVHEELTHTSLGHSIPKLQLLTEFLKSFYLRTIILWKIAAINTCDSHHTDESF